MITAVGIALGAAALAGGAWLARRRWLVVQVRGGSMAPTLRDGQQLLARRGRGYRRGDIVVFRAPRADGAIAPPGEPPYRIKRVAAIAGDPVPSWLGECSGAAGHRVVPARQLVVAGDNPVSEDSRHFGWVPDGAVLGYVRSRPRPGDSPTHRPVAASAGDSPVPAAAPEAGWETHRARARTYP